MAAEQGEKMSAFRSLAPQATGRRALPLAVCILLIAAGAWLRLWLLHSPSPASPHHLHHHAGGHSATSQLTQLPIVVGRTLMTVAMMPPPSPPALTTLNTIAARRRGRALLVL